MLLPNKICIENCKIAFYEVQMKFSKSKQKHFEIHSEEMHKTIYL